MLKMLNGVNNVTVSKIQIGQYLRSNIFKINEHNLADEIKQLLSDEQHYSMHFRDMNRLAGLLWDQNQFAKGLIVLEQAHAEFPAEVSTLGHLSDGYLELKKYAESKNTYNKLIVLLKDKDIYNKPWQIFINEQLEKIEIALTK